MNKIIEGSASWRKKTRYLYQIFRFSEPFLII